MAVMRTRSCIKYGLLIVVFIFLIQYSVSFVYIHWLKRTTDNGSGVDVDALNFQWKSFLHLIPYETNTTQTTDNKTLCLFPPATLRGREKVRPVDLTIEDIERAHNDSELGGRFRPTECQPFTRVAIIVPYRDRLSNLIHLLHYLVPKLKRQQIDFTIYLIEQNANSNFNRGMLRNIGFQQASMVANYSCYIFNDVDTIPEDDRNLYTCSDTKIRHFVTGLDRERYRLPYPNLLGGILGFTGEQFRKVNGYSNLYFQWGAEDDDLCRRMMKANLSMERPPNPYGYITTLVHKRDPKLNKRMTMYRTVGILAEKDGINSLLYNVTSFEKKKLYTHVKVYIDEAEVMKVYNKLPKKDLEKGSQARACSPIRF